MKILVLGNDDRFIYFFKRELLESLVAGGNEVVVALPHGKIVDLIENIGCRIEYIDVDRRGMNPIRDLKLIKSYKKLFKKEQPDKVITFTIKCNIYGGLALKKNVDLFPNITGLGSAFQVGLITKIAVALYKMSIKKKANYVFFENEENKNTFLNYKIITEDKAVLVNGSGVNVENFDFHEMSCSIVPEFLFVGRIMAEKGVDELFEAIERLNKNQIYANFTFLGGFEEDYKNKILDLENRGLISYKGVVNNIKDYLISSDCLILPSYHEGMSNAVLENCSVGRPSIVSNIAGCREAVLDGKSGFLAQPRSADSLYDCIIKFINLSAKERADFGKQARKLMEEKFDRKAVVKKTVAIIMK